MSEVNFVNNPTYSEWLQRNSNEVRGKSELSIDDFLQLMAAQLRNQDMNNPMSEGEFMSQLAQFSSLQAMSNLATLNTTTYSVSLLGKEVTVARLLPNGSLFVETGIVSGVGLFDGDPIIYIGDNKYSLSEIMAVGKLPDNDLTGNKESEEANKTEDGDDGSEETESTEGTEP